MTDPFAVLGLPRRPWVAPDAVRQRYQELAAAAHPDRPGGSEIALAALNHARQTLTVHSQRLRALAPHPTSAQAFQPDWTLFTEIGSLESDAKRWSSAFRSSTSPLQRAVLTAQKKSLETKWSETRRRLDTFLGALEKETREADKRWPESAGLPALAEAWTYAERWSASLDETRALLAGA